MGALTLTPAPASVDVGDQLTLTSNVTDSDGDPANAGAMTLTITQPDLTTLTPTVTNPTTGTYTTSYTVTQAGGHDLRWVATGANANTSTDTLIALDPARKPVIGLSTVKARLNITSNDHDDELAHMLNTASQVGETYTGRVFGRRTITQTVNNTGQIRSHITLDKSPIIAVTTITEDGDTLTSDDYHLDHGAGVVTRADGNYQATWGIGPISITYQAGYVVQPATDIEGALELVRHLWETQRGSYVGPLGNDAPTSPGYAIPNRVAQMWDLNRLAGIA